MLVYTDLSPAQKRWVELVEILHPEIKERGTITYTEIHQFHEEFLKLREVDKRYKVALPGWLMASNIKTRGIYQFPATDVVLSETYDEKMEHMYVSTMLQFGIKPKKVAL